MNLEWGRVWRALQKTLERLGLLEGVPAGVARYWAGKIKTASNCQPRKSFFWYSDSQCVGLAHQLFRKEPVQVEISASPLFAHATVMTPSYIQREDQILSFCCREVLKPPQPPIQSPN